jgi:hypothetical protein
VLIFLTIRIWTERVEGKKGGIGQTVILGDLITRRRFGEHHYGRVFQGGVENLLAAHIEVVHIRQREKLVSAACPRRCHATIIYFSSLLFCWELMTEGKREGQKPGADSS